MYNKEVSGIVKQETIRNMRAVGIRELYLRVNIQTRGEENVKWRKLHSDRKFKVFIFYLYHTLDSQALLLEWKMIILLLLLLLLLLLVLLLVLVLVIIDH